MNRKSIMKKKPIDLSQPHLIPERIKQYALDIFDVVQKYPAVNSDIQKLHLLLKKAEGILAKDPLNSDFFARTRDDKNRLNGLKALCRGDEDWRNIRNGGSFYSNPGAPDPVFEYRTFPYPFFLTYYFDNNLTSPMGALRELIGSEACLLPANDEFLFDNISKEYYQTSLTSQGEQQGDFWNLPSGWEWSTAFNDFGFFQLFNFDLLQDYGDRYSLRPVFVFENFQAANELELTIKKGDVDYHLAQIERARGLKNTIERLLTPSTTNIQFANLGSKIQIYDKRGFSAQPRDIDENDCFSMLSKLLQCNNPQSVATGDAVATAPVGGYSIPMYTDWSLLDRRDIYVFKFWESDFVKVVNELLMIAACVSRDSEEDIAERIKFIVMAEKCGTDVKNNDIKYWGLHNLFAEAQLHDCYIPPALENDFDLFCRKNTPTRTNPYIVEPVLRRNSWMLLSGEEGTGKSFMAMALSAAIATGGKLFMDWRIRQRKAEVLYIADSEMTDDIIQERMSIFRKLYKGCQEKLIVKSVKNLNLLEDGIDYIEKLLQKEILAGRVAEVLVLDHLLKLSGAEGDQKEHWPKIREWIEQLNERGLTVILLHHEYAGSRMLGSRLIAADAPARIHLDVVEQPDGDKINFGVAVVKNRGGKLKREPELISLVIGKHPGWMLADDNKIEPENISFRKMNLEERQNKVIELRNQGMTNPEVANALNCSLSSIEKVIGTLPAEYKRVTKE